MEVGVAADLLLRKVLRLCAEGDRTPVAKHNSARKGRNVFSLNRIGQVLKGLSRGAFQKAVDQHGADRHTKGFGCWDQLVAMVYGQLSQASSLRELQAGFNQYRSHHYHLGTRQVKRSTLADANARRNPEVFAQTAQALMAQAGRMLRGDRQQMLYLLDSTSIALRGRGSQWALAGATRTPGLKLHLLIDGACALPLRQTITAANVNDIDEARKLPIEAGATYVFDKGYCDYNWWSRIDAKGARFVTRLKRNAAVRTLQPTAAVHGEILADELIEFTHRSSRGGHRNEYTRALRRIRVQREGKQPLVLVTNDLHAPAQDIARHYKDRWQIELLFKWIKQHLRIKRFLGQSENAVRIQLLTALIAYLLVLIDNAVHQRADTLWMALAELRAGLFHRPQAEHSRWRRQREHCTYVDAVQPGLFG